MITGLQQDGLLETGVTLVVNPTVAEDKEWKKLEDN
jgi:hypothetical protein